MSYFKYQISVFLYPEWTIKFYSIRLRAVNNVIVCQFPENDISIPYSIVSNIVTAYYVWYVVASKSYRNLLVWFAGIAAMIKYKHIDIIRRLLGAKSPKKEDPTVGFLLHAVLQHAGRVWSGIS